MLIGEPEDLWLLATDAGYGFTVRLKELHSRNRAGKAVLKLTSGALVLPPVPVPLHRRRRGHRRRSRRARGSGAIRKDGCWCSRSPRCRNCRAARATSCSGFPTKKAQAREELLTSAGGAGAGAVAARYSAASGR